MTDANYAYAQDYERYLISSGQYEDDGEPEQCCDCAHFMKCPGEGCWHGMCDEDLEWRQCDDDACGRYLERVRA